MKDLFSTSFTLGILGGGQLGKMLLAETCRYDLRTKVLDPSPEAPCRIGSNEFEVGDLKDESRVLEFARGVDVLTIEIEHVSTSALRKLKEQGIPVHPDPGALSIIQDKGAQKKFYQSQGIPTAPFAVFPGPRLNLGGDCERPLDLALRLEELYRWLRWVRCFRPADGYGPDEHRRRTRITGGNDRF